MTLRELSKLCNVSISTVSKAFSSADDISQETKERIFEVAKKYGCYGKFYKGKYEKKVIAVICPELSNYYIGYVEYIKNLIEKSGGVCIVSTDDFIEEKQQELVDYYISYLKVDGLIVLGFKGNLKKSYDTPIVSVFCSDDSSVDAVSIDLDSAIENAVSLLIDYGHEKIAFFSEKHTKYKAKHFLKTSKELGVKNAKVFESELRFEKAGQDCVTQMLESGEEFSAVLCAYDNIALGAMKEFKRKRVLVPDDISVIGIDNITMGEYSEISLTTIDTNPKEMCQIAWDLLNKKMQNKYYKSKQSIIIKANLVVRESIKKKCLR